eukprot:scaffold4598_cov57-Phaeocystis_antarctica.AAC.1
MRSRRNRQTDRQTDGRQTDKQKDRQTDRQRQTRLDGTQRFVVSTGSRAWFLLAATRRMVARRLVARRMEDKDGRMVP